VTMSLVLALALGQMSAAPSLEAASDSVAKSPQVKSPAGIYVDGADPVMRQLVSTALSRALGRRKLLSAPLAAKSADEAEELARALGLQSVIRLRVSVDAQSLRLVGDIVSTRLNFWSGKVPTRSGTSSVVNVSQPVDEFLRTAVVSAAVPLKVAAPQSSPALTPSEEPLRQVVVAQFAKRMGALAAGDVNQDGKTELAVLFEDALELLDSNGKLIARSPLTTPRAAITWREPLGLVFLQNAPTRWALWSAAHERPEAFSPTQLKSLGTIDELSSDVGTFRFDRSGNHFVVEAKNGKAPLVTNTLQHVSRKLGWTLAVDKNGEASVTSPSGVIKRLPGAGVGSTLVDFDGDGEAEILFSSPAQFGDNDALWMISLKRFERVEDISSLNREATLLAESIIEHGRVMFAVAGEFDGTIGDEVALGVWSESGRSKIVLLRRAEQ
jgi:hypothetical protein